MSIILFLKDPIIRFELVKWSNGNRAKGIWMAFTILHQKFKWLMASYASKVIIVQGTIEIERVNIILFHLLRFILVKPFEIIYMNFFSLYTWQMKIFKPTSIINWPAYVPVIVEHWPADNKPIAQMITVVRPYWLWINWSALNNVMLFAWGVSCNDLADTLVTNKLTTNASNKAQPDSIA